MGIDLAEVKFFPGMIDLFTADGDVYFMYVDRDGKYDLAMQMPTRRIEWLIAQLRQCAISAEADGWASR